MDKIVNDSLSCGYILGYNTDSGLLYKTQCGLNAYKHKKNVVPALGLNPFGYSNKENLENMEETLLDEDKKEFEGPDEEFEIVPNPQTQQVMEEICPDMKGGKTQEKYD